MKSRLILFLSAVFCAVGVFAETAEHEVHAAGVPTMVYWQVFNLAIVIGALIYFTKDSLAEYLSENRKAFKEQAEKFLQTQKEAEEKYSELRSRLQNLDRDHSQHLQNAQIEAERLKNQIIADAQETVRRIQQDASEAKRVEIEKAKRDIREQIVREAKQTTRQVLSRDISGGDQQKLHDGFVHNIQSV